MLLNIMNEDNKARDLSPELLSQQLQAEDQLYYDRLHNQESNIEQYVDEAGQGAIAFLKNENTAWKILSTIDNQMVGKVFSKGKYIS